MNLNIEKLKELLNDSFEGNLHEYVRALKVDPSTVFRIVNGLSKADAKFLGNLMGFCISRGVDFNEFIFYRRCF